MTPKEASRWFRIILMIFGVYFIIMSAFSLNDIERLVDGILGTGIIIKSIEFLYYELISEEEEDDDSRGDY